MNKKSIIKSMPDAEKNRNKEYILIYGITFLYFILHIILLQYHEAWRDEAQAYNLAKNSNILEIINSLKTEGHPILWFLILKLAISIGLPFKYIGYISILFMTLGVFFFLKSDSFSWKTKIIFLISPVFLYYNPVISRVYSISVFIVVLLAYLYQERYQKPILYSLLIALLFQSHILYVGLAFSLTVSMMFGLKSTENRDNKKSIIYGLLICAVSMICTFLELWQTKGCNTFIKVDSQYILSKLNTEQIYKACSSFDNTFIRSNIGFKGIIIAIALIFAVVVAVLLIKKKKYILLMDSLLPIAYYIAIALLVRACDHIQLGIVLMVLMMFAVWIIRSSSEDIINVRCEIILWILVIVSLKSTIIDIENDVTGLFSNSISIVEKIENVVDVNDCIVVGGEGRIAAPCAYLMDEGYTVISSESLSEYRCTEWGKEYNPCSIEEIAGTLGKEYTNIYYIITEQIKEDDNLILINYSDDKNSLGENFWLYKIIE